MINLDEYENTGTHWVALFVKPKYTVYFDSFGIEHIPKKINKFIGNNDIKSNIFRIQAYDSIMCGYFCIEFFNYMLKGKTLLDYTNLFSPNDLKSTIKLLKEYLRMNDLNVIELIDTAKSSSSERANKYRLDEINKIRDYLNNETRERKAIIKKLNKYLVGFDYLDKISITLSASFGTLSIASYASVVGIPASITGASLTLVFTTGTGISKSLLKLLKKEKRNIIK